MKMLKMLKMLTVLGAISCAGYAVEGDAAETSSDETDSASVWTACAGEGYPCSFLAKGDAPVTMRYGAEGNYFYIVSSGLSSLSCGNWDGDPSFGKGKKCDYTTSNILDAPLNKDDGWRHCANEGQACEKDLSILGAQWIRYGTGDTWIYGLRNSNIKFSCNNDYFQYDPAGGKAKKCEVGEVFGPEEDMTFRSCANEGQNCSIAGGESVILRYGYSDDQTGVTGWTYRFAKQSNISCSNSTFNSDPHGGNQKICEYAPIPYPNIFTEGEWTKVSSCSGKGCTISQEIDYGTTRTNSTTTAEQWGVTVTKSVESGFEIKGASSKVSTSVALSYGQSKSFQDAVSHSKMKKIKALCSGVEGVNARSLYQFDMNASDNCLHSGTCTSVTKTQNYACVSNPPASYDGPECVPGYCAASDPNLCQKCDY